MTFILSVSISMPKIQKLSNLSNYYQRFKRNDHFRLLTTDGRTTTQDDHIVPTIYVLSRNKKNNVYPCKPKFYYIKVGFKGVKIIYVCFCDGTFLYKL